MERLRDASRTSPIPSPLVSPTTCSASGPGWALVGDAGYHRDPITGHGITDAFRDAELLADAVHSALSVRQRTQSRRLRTRTSEIA